MKARDCMRIISGKWPANVRWPAESAWRVDLRDGRSFVAELKGRKIVGYRVSIDYPDLTLALAFYALGPFEELTRALVENQQFRGLTLQKP